MATALQYWNLSPVPASTEIAVEEKVEVVLEGQILLQENASSYPGEISNFSPAT